MYISRHAWKFFYIRWRKKMTIMVETTSRRGIFFWKKVCAQLHFLTKNSFKNHDFWPIFWPFFDLFEKSVYWENSPLYRNINFSCIKIPQKKTFWRIHFWEKKYFSWGIFSKFFFLNFFFIIFFQVFSFFYECYIYSILFRTTMLNFNVIKK